MNIDAVDKGAIGRELGRQESGPDHRQYPPNRGANSGLFCRLLHLKTEEPFHRLHGSVHALGSEGAVERAGEERVAFGTRALAVQVPRLCLAAARLPRAARHLSIGG